MSDFVIIDIGLDYTDLPYGRDERDGDLNGKHFRETVLLPALKENKKVIIEMSNALGYGSSFLDEAFAGLIKHGGFTKDELFERLEFKYNKESVKRNIYKYMQEAEEGKKKK
ncbi:STAS-like domain-containing protein [Halomonas sp. FME1]|uniref:STAS-like domain-containing protein n=1 Tax=Halomonas casei TaxID=2742613 RepID=A0ABR9F3V9_9GAMM|nr:MULTISPECIES: STAS-like domain-containing protein [Halomonas]MBE0401163.1 STAS-like domain-containing protein [Halomonas casei]PCC22005.1 hypothetical protein CIK78_08010 [Halomonas sp. JB37]